MPRPADFANFVREFTPRAGTPPALFLALSETLDTFLRRDHPSAEAMWEGVLAFVAIAMAEAMKRGVEVDELYGGCAALALIGLADLCVAAGDEAHAVLMEEVAQFATRAWERICQLQAEEWAEEEDDADEEGC